MSTRSTSSRVPPHITIRVSGKLFEGHLSYLDQLVESAAECHLWPLLSLGQLEEIDRAALFFLMDGADRRFGLISCPDFVSEWMQHERASAAA